MSIYMFHICLLCIRHVHHVRAEAFGRTRWCRRYQRLRWHTPIIAWAFHFPPWPHAVLHDWTTPALGNLSGGNINVPPSSASLCFFFSAMIAYFVFTAFFGCWLLHDIYVKASDKSHLVERHIAQRKHKSTSDRKKFAAVLSSIDKLREIEEENTANKVVQMHRDSMSKLEESLESKKQTAKNRLHTRIANRSKRWITFVLENRKPDVHDHTCIYFNIIYIIYFRS